ncbi:hypothetical protein [Nitratireductor sp. ZSWI3]|uniref:hypothetical protein n=1 Tax=Nitratireductor sp. ZSWI3 TaxID=2966359 RepID=UPI00214F823F|nr:hypothetical protein [Nitratireductor sp. ZSWI3]MCR4267428.1 hypothetical protein [Nitratireductor sp. ZSWI3]
MSAFSLLLLSVSTATFVGAASAAKTWVLLQPNWRWLALTLILYTLGNLIMLRLIRDVGMAVAISLSAIIQLIAINMVALVVFGEKVSAAQGAGLALAIVAVALITLFPSH